MKKLLLALLMTIGLVSAAQAVDLTGNVGLTSDYRFRGISQSQNNMAVQGGVDLTTDAGFYVGNWNSSISSTQYPNAAGVESDVYAGYKKDVWGGVTIDVGSYNYFYPGATNGSGPNFTTNELYAGVGYGPVSFKYSQALSDYFGVANSKNTQYYQLDLNQSLGFIDSSLEKLSFVAHAGRTEYRNNNDYNYADYNVGLNYDYNGWNIAGKYYQNGSYGTQAKSFNTSTNGKELYKDTFVVSVTKFFN